MKNLIIALSVTFMGLSFGANYSIDALKEKDAQTNPAQIQRVFTLKEATANSPTRINLTVVDQGGSTDVSPTLSIFLTYWRDGEESNHTAVFPIASTFSLKDFSDDGKTLTLQLKQYGSPDGEAFGGFFTQTLKVNYGDFSQKFEHEAIANEGELLGTEWVKGTVKVTDVTAK